MADAGFPETLCEAFQATVARHPDAVALRTPGGAVTLTWGQYGERVRQVASGLAGLGVGRGDTVGLMMCNRPEFHTVDTAALHLGAAPFSVYSTLAIDQITHVLGNAGCRVVVCEQQFGARLRAATAGTAVEQVVCLDGRPDGTLTLDEMVAGRDSGFAFDACWRAVAPGDVLTLIYTSGTTGPSKGVELTHAQMVAQMAALVEHLAASDVPPPGPDDRCVSYLPMAHIAERTLTHYWPMFGGTRVTTLADMTALTAALTEVRPTIFAGVPRVWEKLKAGVETMAASESDPARRQGMQDALRTGLEYADATQAGRIPPGLAGAWWQADERVLSTIRASLGLDQVRLAMSGAAPIAPEVLQFMFGLGVPVAELWGMSECSCVGTFNPPGGVRLGTVGTAIPGVRVKLADDGELLLAGPTVMKGYRNDPARTAEALDPDGWLHTGDLATIDADGYVTITGRKKDLIINAAGKNMSPAAIESAVLARSPLIAQVVAIGDRRPYNVALIALDPDTTAAFAARHGIDNPDPAVLASHPAIRAPLTEAVEQANARLSRVEQIKRFAIVPAFWQPGGDEITPTMKAKRQSIIAKYADIIDALYAAPDQPT